jgi:hypothetical protein
MILFRLPSRSLGRRLVLDLRPVITASQRPCGSHLGPKRTSRFVIILSLALFDRVKAKGLAATAEPDARNAPGSSRATAAEGDAIRDSDSRVWPPPSSRSVEKSSASYNRIETRASADVLKFNLDTIHRPFPRI